MTTKLPEVGDQISFRNSLTTTLMHGEVTKQIPSHNSVEVWNDGHYLRVHSINIVDVTPFESEADG